MEDRVKRILTNLETVRQYLLELSDDVWLGIDHNDTQALDEGVQFKRAYNEKLAEFDQVSSDISELVQGFTRVRIDQATAVEPARQARAESQRITRELDKDTPHSIHESFTYTRPYGFVLGDYAANNLLTWRQLYEAFCKVLAQRDPQRFRGLPDNPRFISRKKQFSFDRGDLRNGQPVGHGVYAEVHMSAKNLGDLMSRLLNEFGLSHGDLKIYLRQDRDAEVVE